ncbi:mismatch-specific DNA-glycosylase [Herbidospora mongoliensis]|uniref:mismatch-specific DNA-glycosylase n=1 Tax=Herbidospora mongoliensis TaxID=688067 RepID=UPI00082A9E23|nr:mismatch-specific DNA-glycosylase [Herbidospora mongoliensis]
MAVEGLADVLADGLAVVFIGINPAPVSAAIGHSFATPGNRFWPALHASGFTPTLMRAERERDLLSLGLGITSIVRRPTSQAAQLTRRELADGGRDLAERLAGIHCSWAAFLGVTGYRAAFHAPAAKPGLQPGTIGGARVWVLPNPSGRNAHYPPAVLAAEFTRFRLHTGLPDRSAPE